MRVVGQGLRGGIDGSRESPYGFKALKVLLAAPNSDAQNSTNLRIGQCWHLFLNLQEHQNPCSRLNNGAAKDICVLTLESMTILPSTAKGTLQMC